jgi:hypothetical protein
MVRIMVQGERVPRDVRASETIPMKTVAGGQPVIGVADSPVTDKHYPGRSSLYGFVSR